MDIIMIILRLIHIVGGVFWAGGAIFLAATLGPTVQTAGPEGGRFMQRLAADGRMSMQFSAAAILTTLSGLIMYFLQSYQNTLGSLGGIVLAVAGLAGVAAFAHGFAVQGRTAQRMAVLAKQLAAQNGPPSPEQMAEAQALGARLGRAGRTTAVMLVVAVFGMAIFQYLF